ncbi:hypothetical protein LTR56_016026 [Elasticomyces elasticus]|nr:hypothetical protein LTR56_016026 [Elasticomyces elasticus]KAK3642472.1 hypothetical protein LTR22_016106 [Elasticomyces elasticus]KAK4926955.1 hypothetical protein LTR49_006112 [Elasticomyces elasticus]KAK5764283.1 hypothetical protein LTS12_005496 [Elasticomyces elasticus]
MTTPRSVTPSNTRVKRDGAGQWPMRSAKPREGSTAGSAPKRQRTSTYMGQAADGDNSDFMSIDADHDTDLDMFVALAIGHIILDPPTHPLYQQHIDALLDTCDGHVQFQELVNQVRKKAEELGVSGDKAVVSLSTVYSDRIAEELVDKVVDEAGLAEIVAQVFKRRAEELDQICDTQAFLDSLRQRLAGTANVTIKSEEVAQATDSMRNVVGIESIAHEVPVRLSDSPPVLDQIEGDAEVTTIVGHESDSQQPLNDQQGQLARLGLGSAAQAPAALAGAWQQWDTNPPGSNADHGPPIMSSRVLVKYTKRHLAAIADAYLANPPAEPAVVVRLDCMMPLEQIKKNCQSVFRQFGGYASVEPFGPSNDRRWLVKLRNAQAAVRASRSLRMKKQVGKMMICHDGNWYSLG